MPISNPEPMLNAEFWAGSGLALAGVASLLYLLTLSDPHRIAKGWSFVLILIGAALSACDGWAWSPSWLIGAVILSLVTILITYRPGNDPKKHIINYPY